MQSTAELIEILRQGTPHLVQMAESMDFPWSMDFPSSIDSRTFRKLHNGYARSLLTCYVSKFAQLSESILDSIRDSRYLIYALSGRAMIETTATLRYYVLHQYKPLMDKGTLSAEDMNSLIEIDDRHLRGSRFDWESFLLKRYAELKDDAVKQLQSKKLKQKHVAQGIIQEQVNVITCIEKWAEETPEVLIAYNLFCDLVHPNIGSSFLVASINDNGLHFTPAKGEMVGKNIFEQSFPFLLSTTHKPFSDYLLLLMGTVWQDDEL